MNKSFDILDPNIVQTVAYGKYKKMAMGERSAFERRAEKFAAVTLVHLFPKEGSGYSDRARAPINSFPSRCVNSLAAKMISTLFPYGQNYLRLNLAPDADAVLKDQPDSKVAAMTVLDEIANKLSAEIDAKDRRPVLQEAFKHLIVTGNTCLYVDPNSGHCINYSLRDYVVDRDSLGRLTLLIVREFKRVGELNIDSLREVGVAVPNSEAELEKFKDKYIETFTQSKLNGKGTRFEMCIYINDKKVPNSEGSFPRDALPYVPLRFYSNSNSNYGRSYVEDYYGAIANLQAITYATDKAIQADAKLIFMVEPGSPTAANVGHIARADSGSFVIGSSRDIAPIQSNKQASTSMSMQRIQLEQQQLAEAFLLSSSIRRDAERVTATEISKMAQELEETLSSIYSLLSSELLKAMYMVDKSRMERDGEVPDIDAIAKSIGLKKLAQTVPVTGIASLSKANEADRLLRFASAMSDMGMIGTAVSSDRFARELANAMGLNTASTVLKTQDEIQQAEQQQQLMAAAQTVGPDVVKGEYALQQQQMQQQMPQ